MKTVKIRLSGVDDIRTFVNAVSLYDYDVDLKAGRYVVDAKSIMGIFSLDLSSPTEMIIYGDQEAQLIEKIRKFIVEEQ